jgi:hypothetical protein
LATGISLAADRQIDAPRQRPLIFVGLAIILRQRRHLVLGCRIADTQRLQQRPRLDRRRCVLLQVVGDLRRKLSDVAGDVAYVPLMLDFVPNIERHIGAGGTENKQRLVHAVREARNEHRTDVVHQRMGFRRLLKRDEDARRRGDLPHSVDGGQSNVLARDEAPVHLCWLCFGSSSSAFSLFAAFFAGILALTHNTKLL